MNRSRAAILKQAADAVSGGERTADRSAFQMCESKLLLFSPLALSLPIRPKVSSNAGTLDPTPEGLHSAADNFASKISASPPVKHGSVCMCVCSVETDTVPKMACSSTAPRQSRGTVA